MRPVPPDRQDQGELFRALATRATYRSIPLGVQLELTHACNLDCAMCYLPGSRSAPSTGELTLGEWDRILGELADAGCLFLGLSGGEPLLRPDWWEIARAARRRGFALRLGTNGTLVDDAVAGRIAELRPLGVDVSLHGATARTQDRICGVPGAQDRILRGVEALRRRGVPVVLKCVVTRHNAHELQALVRLAEGLGARIRFDAEVTPRNDGDRGPTRLCVDDVRLGQISPLVWAQEPGRVPASPLDQETRLREPVCAAGRRTGLIGPGGDLFPCVQWPAPVGNLRDSSFAALWQSPVLAALRALTLADLHGCARCAWSSACTPCLALSLLERGDLSGPSDTRCRTAPHRSRGTPLPGPRPADGSTGTDAP